MLRKTQSAVTALVVTAVAAVMLVGCTPVIVTPSASPTPTVTPSVTMAPTPTPTPTPEVVEPTLPTDCAQLGSPATWTDTVGDMTLQSDGSDFVRPAPENAALALGCDWIVGDATGMLLLISTAAPAAVEAAVGGLPGEGFTCQLSEDFGADFCVNPGSSPDTEQMIVARDSVWIFLSTANRNGRALLSEIVQGIFG